MENNNNKQLTFNVPRILEADSIFMESSKKFIAIRQKWRERDFLKNGIWFGSIRIALT